jgi:hypothetical protein
MVGEGGFGEALTLGQLLSTIRCSPHPNIQEQIIVSPISGSFL